MKVTAHNNEERVREAPRFSVNGISEYLVANAARRRRILEEQKRPKSFQVAYYKDAEEAIVDFILSGFKLEELDQKKAALTSTAPASEWDATRRASGLDAIASVRKLAESLDLKRYRVTRGSRSPRRMELSRVSISVRPEILLSEKGDGGEIGAIKLFFSKSRPLSEDRARYIGTILYQYLKSRSTKEVKVGYKHCYVLDVFANQVFRAPRTYQRRSSDLEASCDEISRLWDFV